MIELDLYFRLNNKFIFGPDLSVKNSWWTFRKWGSTFEACWKLNDIRHCTTINVSLRDLFSPGSPSIWLYYSFKSKNVSLRNLFSPGSPVPLKRRDALPPHSLSPTPLHSPVTRHNKIMKYIIQFSTCLESTAPFAERKVYWNYQITWLMSISCP